MEIMIAKAKIIIRTIIAIVDLNKLTYLAIININNNCSNNRIIYNTNNRYKHKNSIKDRQF